MAEVVELHKLKVRNIILFSLLYFLYTFFSKHNAKLQKVQESALMCNLMH